MTRAFCCRKKKKNKQFQQKQPVGEKRVVREHAGPRQSRANGGLGPSGTERLGAKPRESAGSRAPELET